MPALLSLAGGYAPFPTPPAVRTALLAAASAAQQAFSPPEGLPELRAAISARYQRQYGLTVPPAQVVVTPGAKYGLHALLRTLLASAPSAECREVVVATPGWFGLHALVTDAGGQLRPLPLSPTDGYAMHPATLAAVIGPQTRAVVLVNPHNPTGRIYNAAEIGLLLAAVAPYPACYVVADEIYDGLTYDGAQVPSLLAWPDPAGRHVVVHGYSKSLALPGWHVGYVVAPPALAQAVAAYQLRTVTSAGALYQWGAVVATAQFEQLTAALQPPLTFNRQLLLAGLQQLGVAATVPQGGYFVFADLRPWLAPDLPAEVAAAALVDRLRTDFALEVADGTRFGAAGFVRLLFALPVADLREALRRLARGLRASRPAPFLAATTEKLALPDH